MEDSLRNQIARVLADYWDPQHLSLPDDSPAWEMTDSLLSVFDVRLREPQAEETPHGEVVN